MFLLISNEYVFIFRRNYSQHEQLFFRIDTIGIKYFGTITIVTCAMALLFGATTQPALSSLLHAQIRKRERQREKMQQTTINVFCYFIRRIQDEKKTKVNLLHSFLTQLIFQSINRVEVYTDDRQILRQSLLSLLYDFLSLSIYLSSPIISTSISSTIDKTERE